MTTTGTRGEVVETRSGPVAGLREDGVSSFRGIPYAAPPFGARRFLGPMPHDPWTEPLEAFAFGPTAPQNEGASPGGLPDAREPIIAGEEILNLNVWTPSVAPDGPALPVLVWIHGGGFFAGGSANPWYDGASFARQGLVLVSINYRLGAEGFLELEGATSNRALRDWLAALDWVQENVGAFGGDPRRVTVMGQSAGGMAVSALLAGPVAAGRFHQAVIASGVSEIAVATAEQARATARTIAAAVGGRPTRASMLHVDPQRFVAAHDAIVAEAERAGADISLMWVPVLDGDQIDDTLFDAVAAGRAADVPLLVGTTENEFAWRTLREAPESEEARRIGQERFADALFRRPTERLARLRVQHASAPTYRYEFRWRSTAAPYIRAGHSLDIPFFFNTLAAPYVEGYSGPNPPQDLATFEHEAFARYVRDGDPGWPPFGQDDSVMLFDAQPRVTAGLAL